MIKLDKSKLLGFRLIGDGQKAPTGAKVGAKLAIEDDRAASQVRTARLGAKVGVKAALSLR